MHELICNIDLEETSVRLERWATVYYVKIEIDDHLYCYLDESLEESLDMMQYIMDLLT